MYTKSPAAFMPEMFAASFCYSSASFMAIMLSVAFLFTTYSQIPLLLSNSVPAQDLITGVCGYVNKNK